MKTLIEFLKLEDEILNTLEKLESSYIPLEQYEDIRRNLDKIQNRIIELMEENLKFRKMNRIIH